MANFELRIYVIPAENIDEVIENNGIHDTSDLTDTQFVEVAEELGTVYTLGKFLNLDVIAPDTDVIRAFFIDKDNEDTAPVRADGYETTITASKITCTAPTNNGQSLEFNHVLFEDNSGRPFGKNIKSEEPISRTYTIVLTNHDSENSFTGIIADIQDKDYVQDVDLLEEYDNKVRLQIETDGDIDFDKLCTDLEDWLGVTADLISEVENY
jgi:hypothetical protein